MNESIHQTEINLPLDQLVARALEALETLRYSRRTLRRYRAIWQHFVTFCREGNLGVTYSSELATQFCSVYQVREGECIKPSDGWRQHVMFGLKVLEDFACNGCIERAVTDMQRIQVPSFMKKPISEYELYCRDRLHVRPTTL